MDVSRKHYHTQASGNYMEEGTKKSKDLENQGLCFEIMSPTNNIRC